MPLAPCRRSRHAITLLEVLMSMFVLAVGLVSVASLLPVGGFQVARALLDDRKAVLGQNEAREAKTRGVLRPDWWYYANGKPYVINGNVLNDPYTNKPITDTASQTTPPIPLPAVCIDPWMANWAQRNSYVIPGTIDYFASGGITNLPVPAPRLEMKRLSLVQPTGATITNGSFANDQSFINGDDITYSVDQTNPDSPPAFGFNRNGNPRVFDSSGNPIIWNGVAAGTGTKRAYAGQFTWLATLVPVYGDPTIVVNRNLMDLSVVVFNQRIAGAVPPNDPSKNPAPTERAALAALRGSNSAQFYPGGGAGTPIGAAEMQIYDLNSVGGNPAASDANIGVKAGEWIMLGTMITDWNMPLVDPTSPPSATNLPIPRPMFRWYRAVTVGPLMLRKGETDTLTYHPGDNQSASYYARDITLSGPEWNLATVAGPQVQIGATSNGTKIFARDTGIIANTNVQLFFAFIYDGAVAVYERTVRLEGPSMWSQ